jgi:Zn-dependent protease
VEFQQIIFNVVTTVGLLILAIAVHEWAHVAMARFLGDPTGERMGRLTLNPLAHADPVWTVALPTYFVVMQTLAGSAFPVPFFGAGKPAPYTPVKLDRRFGGKRIHMRTAEMLVALAGPVSNIVMAVLTTGLVVVLVRAGHPLFEDPRSLALLAFKFVVLNIGLFLFNLIPIPPLDGSKVVFNLLPHSLGVRFEAVVERFSWILLMLLVLGGARFILAPIQGVIISALLDVVQLLT